MEVRIDIVTRIVMRQAKLRTWQIAERYRRRDDGGYDADGYGMNGERLPDIMRMGGELMGSNANTNPGRGHSLHGAAVMTDQNGTRYLKPPHLVMTGITLSDAVCAEAVGRKLGDLVDCRIPLLDGLAGARIRAIRNEEDDGPGRPARCSIELKRHDRVVSVPGLRP